MKVELSVWGKARGLSRPYPLLAHLVDTAAFAYTLLADHLPSPTLDALGLDHADEERLRSFAFLAGLHDLGKATPTFQRQSEDAQGTLSRLGFSSQLVHPSFTIRHSALTTRGARGDGIRQLSWRASQRRSGHSVHAWWPHGLFHHLESSEIRPLARSQLPFRAPQLGTGLWEEQRIAHVEALSVATGVSGPVLELAEHQLVLGAGVVVIADWLASQVSGASALPTTGPHGTSSTGWSGSRRRWSSARTQSDLPDSVPRLSLDGHSSRPSA